MFKLNAKFDADLLLYSLSHFECDSHTVHMLTQQHPLSPLTSTVKSSLFMHAHFSPLSLAARLHRCHTNCSRYSNNGWTLILSFLWTEGFKAGVVWGFEGGVVMGPGAGSAESVKGLPARP